MNLTVNILLGLIAIALAIVALRQIRKRKPAWSYQTTKVIGLGTDAPSELKLMFNDKQISEVFRTLLIFFNQGKRSIQQKDVTDTISICFKGADFLRDPYSMILNKPENRIKVINKGDNEFNIEFSFLDHNDGVIVEVLHTKCEQIECEGYVLEAGRPKYIGEFKPHRPENWRITIGAVLVLIATFTWMVVSSVLSAIRNPNNWGDAISMIVLVLLFVATAIASKPARFFRHLLFPVWSRHDYDKDEVM